MTLERYGCPIFPLALSFLLFLPHCSAQELTKCSTDSKAKDTPVITPVTVCADGDKAITQMEIDLQKTPNNMEPEAEPRLIRIDDRANVQFLLVNLSPLDLCTRSASPPTPTPETNVAESLATTIAGLFGGSGAAAGAAGASTGANAEMSALLSKNMLDKLKEFAANTAKCDAKADPEYQQIIDKSNDFFPEARDLVGPSSASRDCVPDNSSQTGLACGIDQATRKLAKFAGDDYRKENQGKFKVEGNTDLNEVRKVYTASLPSFDQAGRLQAMVDEIAAWDADLHKKYDYKLPSGGASAPTLPRVVPGALTVAPTSVALTSKSLSEVVRLSSGRTASTFTATPTSDSGWLRVSKPGGSPIATALSDTAPASGFYELVVTADPSAVPAGDATTHTGSIAISGTGSASGTTTVRVTFNRAALPSQCDLDRLAEADIIVDRAKAEMSLISDNNKTLEGAQATLKTAYMALLKVEDDFKRRRDVLKIVVPNTQGVLVQQFNLPTDRKGTSTGFLACVSAIDGKTPTTTNINYTLLYQDVPHWSASAGFLTSFLEKKVIGLEAESSPPNQTAGTQFLELTDKAAVQVVPMAFANYRVLPYAQSQFGKGKESQLVWTANLSGGFGVNPNTGTNQPEFFAGLALGLNRFLLHLGCDWGRVEQPGGGYTWGAQFINATAAPIDWRYHPKFSIGFSVRVAPY